MLLQPSITSGLYIVNYPLIILAGVVVIVVLYKFMKQRQVESTMDDSWLGSDSESNQ